MAKAAAGKKSKKTLTKSQLFTNLADATGLKKNQVSAVFDALAKEIQTQLKQNDAIALPGLVKIVKKKKPASVARQMQKPGGAPGEMITVPAKPASMTVRARALKPLKEMVS